MSVQVHTLNTVTCMHPSMLAVLTTVGRDALRSARVLAGLLKLRFLSLECPDSDP